jgi:hypothetical protein
VQSHPIKRLDLLGNFGTMRIDRIASLKWTIPLNIILQFLIGITIIGQVNFLQKWSNTIVFTLFFGVFMFYFARILMAVVSNLHDSDNKADLCFASGALLVSAILLFGILLPFGPCISRSLLSHGKPYWTIAALQFLNMVLAIVCGGSLMTIVMLLFKRARKRAEMISEYDHVAGTVNPWSWRCLLDAAASWFGRRSRLFRSWVMCLTLALIALASGWVVLGSFYNLRPLGPWSQSSCGRSTVSWIDDCWVFPSEDGNASANHTVDLKAQAFNRLKAAARAAMASRWLFAESGRMALYEFRDRFKTGADLLRPFWWIVAISHLPMNPVYSEQGRLLLLHDRAGDAGGGSFSSLQAFLASHPKWSVSDIQVTVQRRRQKGPNCFLQAAFSEEAYYRQYLNQTPTRQLDITWFTAFGMSDRKFFEFSFKIRGGYADKRLKLMFPPGKVGVYDAAADLTAYVRGGRPVLISTFHVPVEMLSRRNNGSFSSVTGKWTGANHAVVTLATTNVDGTDWFLVQNWWDGLEFFEATLEWFVLCEAKWVKLDLSDPGQLPPRLSGARLADTWDVLVSAFDRPSLRAEYFVGDVVF